MPVPVPVPGRLQVPPWAPRPHARYLRAVEIDWGCPELSDVFICSSSHLLMSLSSSLAAVQTPQAPEALQCEKRGDPGRGDAGFRVWGAVAPCLGGERSVPRGEVRPRHLPPAGYATTAVPAPSESRPLSPNSGRGAPPGGT